MTRADLVVAGASSQVGRCLLRRAPGRYPAVVALSRRPPDENRAWRLHDLEHGWPADLAARCLVHAAPLSLLPPLVREAAQGGLERVVAFSSTSVAVKARSPDPVERAVARRLAAAESALRDACAKSGVRWTVLRPTLIYGVGLDRNLSALAAVIRRLRVLPLPAGGGGLRQPVHADDLAAVSLSALKADAAAGRAFELAGGSTLAYRDMAAALFRAQGLEPRFLPLPATACRAAVRVLRLLPAFRELPVALVDRIAEDLVFDDSAAREALGWNPRPFDPRAAVSPRRAGPQ